MPKARKTDPITSKLAAQSVQAQPQKIYLLEAYATNKNGLTADEAFHVAVDKNNRPISARSYWKRISELIEEGLLLDTEYVRKSDTGRYSRVAKITKAGIAHLKAHTAG